MLVGAGLKILFLPNKMELITSHLVPDTVNRYVMLVGSFAILANPDYQIELF